VVIDSGLGGLSVVRALLEIMPGEQIVFLADTARGPYYNKSAETVSLFTHHMLEHTRRFDPKHVVIACNVAAALVMATARKRTGDLSLSGIVDAAARAAVEAAGARHAPVIGVIAAESTIRSKTYERAIHRRRHHARLLLRPTPLLDAIAEESRDDKDSLVRLALRQYLGPVVERGANVIVLGSAWYSVLADAARGVVGDNVAVVDGAEACAQDVRRRLQAAGLLRPGMPAGNGQRVQCVLTDDTPRFRFLAKRLLGRDVAAAELISLHELEQSPLPQLDLRVPA
jgi:glutamate racemase